MTDRTGWEEFARFSHKDGDDTYRQQIWLDQNRNFHLDITAIKADGTERKNLDAHGEMSATAYANWLSTVLFNHAYKNASTEEKEWMMADGLLT